MRERSASPGASGSGSPRTGSWPPSGAPAARNAAGSDHASSSIRPRSAPSMSGRHRARHPSAVSSSDGMTRPRVVNSRAISAARAANRKSAARAMPDSSVVDSPTVSPATAINVERTSEASVHSTIRPGTVHRGSSGEADGSDDGSVRWFSSHGEPTGPPPASGSRSISSVSPHLSGPPIDNSPSSVTASRMGLRTGSPGRAPATGRCRSRQATILRPQGETAGIGQPHGVEDDHLGILPRPCDAAVQPHPIGSTVAVMRDRPHTTGRLVDARSRSQELFDT